MNTKEENLISVEKPKKYILPKEVQTAIKERKELHKRLRTKLENGENDSKLEKQFKKHNNYCNKLIKKAVREKNR